GALSPGGATGTAGRLTVGNSLRAFGTNNQMVIDLNGGTVATQYDQVKVVGDVDLSNIALSINLGAGFTPSLNQVFPIIATDGGDAVAGPFSGLPEGSLLTSGASVFRISYVASGNDVTLTYLGAAFTWDGGGSNNNWSTGANWVGDVAPAANAFLL